MAIKINCRWNKKTSQINNDKLKVKELPINMSNKELLIFYRNKYTYSSPPSFLPPSIPSNIVCSPMLINQPFISKPINHRFILIPLLFLEYLRNIWSKIEHKNIHFSICCMKQCLLENIVNIDIDINLIILLIQKPRKIELIDEHELYIYIPVGFKNTLSIFRRDKLKNINEGSYILVYELLNMLTKDDLLMGSDILIKIMNTYTEKTGKIMGELKNKLIIEIHKYVHLLIDIPEENKNDLLEDLPLLIKNNILEKIPELKSYLYPINKNKLFDINYIKNYYQKLDDYLVKTEKILIEFIHYGNIFINRLSKDYVKEKLQFLSEKYVNIYFDMDINIKEPIKKKYNFSNYPNTEYFDEITALIKYHHHNDNIIKIYEEFIFTEICISSQKLDNSTNFSNTFIENIIKTLDEWNKYKV